MEGILNLDKPAGITSARAVGVVKRLLPRGTKIGHAGTLDPFATGVLLLLIGRATKSCERLMDQPKQYETTVKFGVTTATDDGESPEIPWPVPLVPVSEEAVRAALAKFVGDIMQRPPIFSAMKVGGRRAYDLARKGAAVQLQPRQVEIYSIQLLDLTWPLLRLRIDCGRGTYIRAIARDLGAELNVGGSLVQLRRTRIGKFDIADAVSLDALNSGNLLQHITPLDETA